MTQKGMPLMPAALKRCIYCIILVISSTEIVTGECISAGYEALEVSVR